MQNTSEVNDVSDSKNDNVDQSEEVSQQPLDLSINQISLEDYPNETSVDNEPSWTIYPLESYGVKILDRIEEPSQNTPLDEINGFSTKMENFVKDGICRSAAALMLTHRYLYPHVVLLQNDLTNEWMLPNCTYKIWENPRTVLANYLKTIFLSNSNGSNNQNQTDNVVSNDVANNDIADSEVVSNEVVCNDGTSNDANNDDTSNSCASNFCVSSDGVNNDAAANDNVSNDGAGDDGDLSKNTNGIDNTVEVGEYLGTWWRTEFNYSPLPYLPPHSTRPKEAIRIYQVILPPKLLFKLPKYYVLKSLPLFDLDPNIFGIACGSIPQLISRFQIQSMIQYEE